MPVREAFLENVNATNSTRAQLICEDICALCAHLWLGELPRWATPGAGARAVIKSQLNSRRELPYVR